jgi:hypothetical protein
MSNKERFNEWMKIIVQSIYYSDNNLMCQAYERISE